MLTYKLTYVECNQVKLFSDNMTYKTCLVWFHMLRDNGLTCNVLLDNAKHIREAT